MRRAKLFILFVLMGSSRVVPARAQSVDEVLEKNLSARGGAASLAALKSLRLTGKVSFGSGDSAIEADWGVVIARPGSVRSEVTLQGLTMVEAFDGHDAFRISPFGGRLDPEKLSADEAKGQARDAELDGTLQSARTAGHRVELLGTEDIDGTAAIKLRVTRKDGDTQFIYLDPDAYLEIRITTLTKLRGSEQTFETDLGAYERVAGVYFPFSIEGGPRGRPRESRITVERAEPNVTLDASLFRTPSKGASLRQIVAEPGAALAAATPPPPTAAVAAAQVDSAVVSGLAARNIGSAAMSGRISSVAAANIQGKTLLYVGAASGGVWKSADGGTTFKPVFDKQAVQSIGSIAIDPQNPQTVWVGTGEAWTRNSVSIGDGIYRSGDGGETWTNMGLPNSERIARVLVSPKNSSVVYACVPGKLWSDSAERGLYKTVNAGKSWTLILKGKNLSTGCSSVAIDPRDPRIVYAGLWDFRRKGWTFRSGGEGPEAESGSGLYRSDDAGHSWTALGLGLPAAPWGRVEVALAPSSPNIVYALIESNSSALYYSEDGGKNWQARDRSQHMVWRPFYFARLIVDPKNPQHVFKPGLNLIVSDDGGKSFANASGGSHGDWHDLWIDPENPQHMIGGDDGGLWLSWDGGSRWFKGANLPISQFYHVSLDDRDPYQVYGGLQDNSTWVGDSAYPGGITNQRWENLYGGDGFWAFVDPTDRDFVYAESQGGFIGRIDRKTLAARDIQPKAGYHEKLRFNWNTPIHFSPTQRGTLYIGAQYLFRSRDRGENWQRISGDLSTNDPSKQKQEQSGGVTVDNSSAEMHTSIYSISESPKDSGLIWVGTDDGQVQLTRDGGRHWRNLTANIAGLPPSSWVSWIEASRFDAGSAYIAFDRHSFGDMNAYIYKTSDYGATWRRIGSPEQGLRGYVHVIKQDLRMPPLLYAGTEFGLFVSLDEGATWSEFKGGDFPSVSVRDLALHAREDDLVIATHGRGLWIIDDLAPLRALRPELLQRSAAFLPGRPAQQRLQAQGGWPEGDATFSGQNPASGAVISYYLRARHIFGPLSLEVLDPAGKLIDTLTATKRRGINRVEWSMRIKPPRVPRAAQIAFGASVGPRVQPGQYTVRLSRGSEVLESPLQIELDRRAPYNAQDRKRQLAALSSASALFGRMTELTDKLDAARAAIGKRISVVAPDDAFVVQLRAADERLAAIKKQIVATTEGGAITGEERIREHLDELFRAWNEWEGRPTAYQLERMTALTRELDDVQAELDRFLRDTLPALDRGLLEHKLEPISTASAHSPPSQLVLACVESKGANCGAGQGEVAEH